MKIYETFPVEIEKKQRAVALGFFDGVHLGHQKLLEELLKVSEKNDLSPMVFTFQDHPASTILANYEFPGLIQTQEMRFEKLQKFGVEEVISAPLVPEITHIPAEEFFFDILCKQLDAKVLIIGEDAKYGYKGEGNVSKTRAWAVSANVELIVVQDMIFEGKKISSTLIREDIEQGDVASANLMLGSPFSIKGKVVKGKQLGKTLGFPTINITQDEVMVTPKFGVYASFAIVNDKTYPSITSVGTNPTVEDNRRVKIETYIYHQDINLYDETVYIELLDFIRDEIRFPNVDSMIDRIMEDIKLVEKFHQKNNYL